MRTMARSILVTETYLQATKARIHAGDDSAALTLMSTDMERIRIGFMDLHEFWACLIQAAIAAWMLYNRLGIVFVAPIGLVLVVSIYLSYPIDRSYFSLQACFQGSLAELRPVTS